MLARKLLPENLQLAFRHLHCCSAVLLTNFANNFLGYPKELFLISKDARPIACSQAIGPVEDRLRDRLRCEQMLSGAIKGNNQGNIFIGSIVYWASRLSNWQIVVLASRMSWMQEWEHFWRALQVRTSILTSTMHFGLHNQSGHI